MVKVLVTGGAGFVGSHTVDRLVSLGHEVVSLDSLDPQVHGAERRPPAWLNPNARYVTGDCRDVAAVSRALDGCTHVLHLAAAVGVGQSMYQITRYTDVNCTGTSILLEALVAARARIERLVVASSMSSYGEGLYLCAGCGPIDRGVQRQRTLEAGERLTIGPEGSSVYEPACPRCGARLQPLPTPEEKAIEPASIYALGKYYQEVACLVTGAAYGIPTIALRYFNIYGPRQALSNPYTGVAAIFCARLLHGKAPFIYEDGRQRRDFVHVSDVAEANAKALFARPTVTGPINVGSGEHRSVLDIANVLIAKLSPGTKPTIAHELRAGDTRHCFADITRARALLDYQPGARFETQIDELVQAVKDQGKGSGDAFDAHRKDLVSRGLAA